MTLQKLHRNLEEDILAVLSEAELCRNVPVFHAQDLPWVRELYTTRVGGGKRLSILKGLMVSLQCHCDSDSDSVRSFHRLYEMYTLFLIWKKQR